MPSDSLGHTKTRPRSLIVRAHATSFLAVSGVLLTGLLAISLSAQTNDLNGTWTASSLRVSWAVGDWGEACGPRPSGGAEAGGRVTLSQDGAGFLLEGLGRSYQSGQCWEQMPGLATRNRSASSATISATCSMPVGDPRQAKVITSWYPRGEEIYFDETGQYQFVVSGSNCTASVRRTRVLTRIREVVPAKQPEKTSTTESLPENPVTENQPNTAPPPPPGRSSQCATPGQPTEIEVTPRSKLMRQGETFKFQLNARDTSGCRVPVSTIWTIVSGKGAKISSSGELRVDDNAPTADLKLSAQAFGQTLFVTARVVTEQEYERLIEGGSFGVLGESLETTAVQFSSSHIELDTPALPEKKPSTKPWLLFILGILLLLSCAVIWILRRTTKMNAAKNLKKSSVRETLPESQTDSVVTEAPSAHATLPATIFVDPLEQTTHAAPPAELGTSSRLCPVCGKRYDEGTTFCGEDGARLMRAN